MSEDRSGSPASVSGAALPVELPAVARFGPRLRPRGLFVTFEGIEGAGKSLQLSLLARRLRTAGVSVVATREPGGTRLGKRLRQILLETAGEPVSPRAELHLYVADRIQHLLEVVEPALDRGDVVLCDRYADATLAYQGYGRMLPLDSIEELHRRSPLGRKPTRTLLLDLEPATGLARARLRDAASASAAAEARMEAEALDFHHRVRDGYLALARMEPDRFRVVPADGAPDDVQRRVWDAVQDLFEELE
jgi:dTMP kinase